VNSSKAVWLIKGFLRGGVRQLLLLVAGMLSSALSVLPCEGKLNVVWPPHSTTDALAALMHLKPLHLSGGCLCQMMHSGALALKYHICCALWSPVVTPTRSSRNSLKCHCVVFPRCLGSGRSLGGGELCGCFTLGFWEWNETCSGLKLHQGSFRFAIRKNFCTEELSGIGTGCLGEWWSPHPSRGSKTM